MRVLGQLSRNKLTFAKPLRLHPVTRREEVRKHNGIDSERRGSFGVGCLMFGSVFEMYWSQRKETLLSLLPYIGQIQSWPELPP